MSDEAFLAAREPWDPECYEDPDSAPPPGMDEAQRAALVAEAH